MIEPDVRARSDVAPRIAKTLANGQAAEAIFCDLVASLHLYRKCAVDLERFVEIGELQFSEF